MQYQIWNKIKTSYKFDNFCNQIAKKNGFIFIENTDLYPQNKGISFLTLTSL